MNPLRSPHNTNSVQYGNNQISMMNQNQMSAVQQHINRSSSASVSMEVPQQHVSSQGFPAFQGQRRIGGNNKFRSASTGQIVQGPQGQHRMPPGTNQIYNAGPVSRNGSESLNNFNSVQPTNNNLFNRAMSHAPTSMNGFQHHQALSYDPNTQHARSMPPPTAPLRHNVNNSAHEAAIDSVEVSSHPGSSSMGNIRTAPPSSVPEPLPEENAQPRYVFTSDVETVTNMPDSLDPNTANNPLSVDDSFFNPPEVQSSVSTTSPASDPPADTPITQSSAATSVSGSQSGAGQISTKPAATEPLSEDTSGFNPSDSQLYDGDYSDMFNNCEFGSPSLPTDAAMPTTFATESISSQFLNAESTSDDKESEPQPFFIESSVPESTSAEDFLLATTAGDGLTSQEIGDDVASSEPFTFPTTFDEMPALPAGSTDFMQLFNEDHHKNKNDLFGDDQDHNN